MNNYHNNYKITALNYSNNYCYIEGIFDLSNFINKTINISIDSIIESNYDLSFTLQQVHSSDLPNINYFKEYFLIKTTVTNNKPLTINEDITLKYAYLNLVLGVKLSNDLFFSNPFDYIYRFNFKVNDIRISPLYFGETMDNMATIELLDSQEVVTPPDPTDCNLKDYVDSEIEKVTTLIPQIEVYPLEELAKISKRDNIIYFGY